MTPEGESPDWIQRLQNLVNETVERSTASTANLQRLLAAVAGPGFPPGLLGTELPRFGQEYGPEAYRRLVEIYTRFLSRSLRLVSRYRDDYLSGLLPPGRIAAAGRPSAVPSPPDGANATEWAGWYQLFGAWVTEQQTWAGRLYAVLLDEVRAGSLKPEDVQVSAQEFLRRRLPDYLADMAELNAELVTDILGVADGSIDALSDQLVRRPEHGGAEGASGQPDAITVEVRGIAGTTASTRLLVENSLPDAAALRCDVSALDGFGLATAPVEFRLGPGESRAVTVHVALPAEPTAGQRPAGSVIVRGHGDRDLVVRVRATAEPAPMAPAPGDPATPPGP
ncbi:MAG TPA: hypothetical protein VET24_16830 [Actinomycetota bacterium]|nr:hypothetical protein [Actinomycetota bacterium]